jgi:hypothetical protein
MAWLLVLAFVLVGCGDPSTSTPDAGSGADEGAVVDVVPPVDAGPDTDAMPAPDAVVVPDAGSDQGPDGAPPMPEEVGSADAKHLVHFEGALFAIEENRLLKLGTEGFEEQTTLVSPCGFKIHARTGRLFMGTDNGIVAWGMRNAAFYPVLKNRSCHLDIDDTQYLTFLDEANHLKRVSLDDSVPFQVEDLGAAPVTPVDVFASAPTVVYTSNASFIDFNKRRPVSVLLGALTTPFVRSTDGASLFWGEGPVSRLGRFSGLVVEEFYLQDQTANVKDLAEDAVSLYWSHGSKIVRLPKDRLVVGTELQFDVLAEVDYTPKATLVTNEFVFWSGDGKVWRVRK